MLSITWNINKNENQIFFFSSYFFQNEFQKWSHMSQIVIIIYLYITSQFVVLKTWLVYKCTFIIYCFDKTFWKKAHFRRKSHHNFVLVFFKSPIKIVIPVYVEYFGKSGHTCSTCKICPLIYGSVFLFFSHSILSNCE